MDVEKLKIEISQIDWSLYTGPLYYEPDRVTKELINLITLDREEQKNSVYNNALFAIGNNHAGTYYPAILGALKYIIMAALHGNNEIIRNCALDILIDLYATFVPSSDIFNDISVEEFVLFSIEAEKDKFNGLSSSTFESLRNRQLAKELLEYIIQRNEI